MLKPTTLSTSWIKNPTNTAPAQFLPGPDRYRNWTAGQPVHTNVNLKTTATNLLGLAALSFGSITGIPQIGQVGESLADGFENSLSGRYTTLPLNRLTNKLFPNTNITTPVLYRDFRSKFNVQLDDKTGVSLGNQLLSFATSRRLDGLSAATRGSVKAGIYSGLAATPIGAYSTFNLDGAGISGYGWGEHDNPHAIRKDFTMRSHVAKNWSPKSNLVSLNKSSVTYKGSYQKTKNPVEVATPFRGDRVNVIDFGQRALKDVYLWNPSRQTDKFLGMDLNKTSITQDFIKFYFTGPKLDPSKKYLMDEDDIIVFRAVITSLSDTFTPEWAPQNMIGRADPNYIYSGYARSISINFDIYATDRDEMQPIYRKLNALAGYTAPTYDPSSITMEAPWMRLTIGDLFYQQPAIINALSYTYAMDAPWEINIEDDPNMMQVPMKISVQCGFNLIMDQLPQKGGRFFTLAKRFEADGTPITGNDNWLSDTNGNFNALDEETRTKSQKGKVVGKSTPSRNPTTTLTTEQQAAVDALNKFGPLPI